MSPLLVALSMLLLAFGGAGAAILLQLRREQRAEAARFATAVERQHPSRPKLLTFIPVQVNPPKRTPPKRRGRK